MAPDIELWYQDQGQIARMELLFQTKDGERQGEEENMEEKLKLNSLSHQRPYSTRSQAVRKLRQSTHNQVQGQRLGSN